MGSAMQSKMRTAMREDMLILEAREALVDGPPSLLVASEFALLAETVAAQSAILLGWWVKRSRESRVNCSTQCTPPES
jgi:hypothetical protein